MLYVLMVLLPLGTYGAGFIQGQLSAYNYLKRTGQVRPEVSFLDWLLDSLGLS